MRLDESKLWTELRSYFDDVRKALNNSSVETRDIIASFALAYAEIKKRSLQIGDTIMSALSNQQYQDVTVRLGIIGHGESGKTCMLNAVRRTVTGTYIGKQLHLGMLNAEKAKEELVAVRQAEGELRSSGALGMTLFANDFQYAIFEGASPVVTFVYHDAIGQLLQRINLGDEEQEDHDQFITRLTAADILWAVLPVRKEDDRKEFYIDPDELHRCYGLC